MSDSFFTPLAIVVMAAITYLMRIAGFWLMGHVRLTPRIRRMLEALPGAVIAATVVPIVAKLGLPAALAIGTVLLMMVRFRNEFLAIAAGIGVAALVRGSGL
jgi:uncharacterized membrane protein